MRYSLEPNTENMYKDMAFCHLLEYLKINMKKNGYCNIRRIRCYENCF